MEKARWVNSGEQSQWIKDVLDKLSPERRQFIMDNWAKNGFKNPKAYLNFLNKFGH